MTYVTRFAPSPTGPLHLGHAYSALTAFERARAIGGRFLLRIEDIDRQRSKPEWEAQIYDDLRWLGIDWEEPVMRQSDRLPAYAVALDGLWRRGLLYPCTCNRRDIADALSAPQEGAQIFGPDGPIYPGTCRDKPHASPKAPRPEGVLRLDMRRATGLLYDEPGVPPFFRFSETGASRDGWTGEIAFADQIQTIGDIVLSRKDFLGSYHLSVVLDDAAQGVTEVIRGEDLFEATKIHVVLQRLLGLPTPTYHHHTLIRDDAGKRLAKRDDARAIRTYREDGATPQDIRALVGLT